MESATGTRHYESCVEDLLTSVIQLMATRAQMMANTVVCKGFQYELEIRFSLDDDQASKVKQAYRWDTVDRYTEAVLVSEEYKTRTRRSQDETVSTTKKEIYSVSHRDIYASCVLSSESSVLSTANKRPSRVSEVERFIKRFPSLFIDLKTKDGRTKLEIEITEDSREALTELREQIDLIMKACHNSSEPICKTEMDLVKSFASCELKSCSLSLFQGRCPNPHSISARRYGSLYGYTCLAMKMNGERRYLCCTQGGAYGINRSGSIHPIKATCSGYHLLDCEFYNDTYYVFDCVLYDEEDVSILDLKRRLEFCTSCVEDIRHGSNLSIVVKPYMDVSDKDLDHLVDLLLNDNMEDTYDGIVLVNPEGNYNAVQYKIKVQNSYDLLFDGVSFKSSDGVIYDVTGNDLRDAGVYEAVRNDKGSMIVTRYRRDKAAPNHSSVIEETKTSMSLEDLRKDPINAMRRYHNEVKLRLLERILRAFKNPTLLDLGTGRGGDYKKWRRFNKVFCVEPSSAALDEFRRRHGKPPRCILIQTKTSNHVFIKSVIDVPINSITMFFSLMMFTYGDMNSLHHIIKSKCSENCVVQIITTDPLWMSKNVPNSGDFIRTPFYSVSRLSRSEVMFDITGSFVEANREYVPNIAYLKVLLSRLGFDTSIDGRTLYGDIPLVSHSRVLSSAYLVYEFVRGSMTRGLIKSPRF